MAITINGTDGITLPNGGLLDPDGAMPVFGCRSWVNFTGSTGAVKAAGNATVSRSGSGTYTVTFPTAMPDANYSFSISFDGGTGARGYGAIATTVAAGALSFVIVNASNALFDPANVAVAVFR